jgi:hypothetical protein
MRKNEEKKTEPHMGLKSSQHKVISSIDLQKITVMFKISG